MSAVQYTSTHWGIYEVDTSHSGGPRLRAFADDPDPSPIGLFQVHDEVTRLRIRRPAVRESWLKHGPGACTDRRGAEKFVELDWPDVTDLLARELARVRDTHGNDAIFGGSYGWASAGRFHHAQSQVHRFLNTIGGYVRHVDSYSLGAAHVLMPHIVAPMTELMGNHTSWDALAEHTRLFVTFGGVPLKNAQISSGGAGTHRVREGLRRMRDSGTRFVNIGPVRDNLDTGGEVEWIPIRPNTDTALMLALAHVIYTDNRFDRSFIDRNTTGFDRFAPYLTGAADGTPKDPVWASAITGVPAGKITALAREMAGTRTMLNVSWSMQRAAHGEQPYWMLVTLASMLGQIGLPGGGFGVGYGAMNLMGSPHPRLAGPALPQGENPVRSFIPVARISDMLLNPGKTFTYNGATHIYPDIHLVYWAGGNPFHHHQDLHRLLRAWQKPDTIVVHEQYWTPTARRADIVLPATTMLERNDIGFASREGYFIAMRKAAEPLADSRDDYTIFADIAERMGVGREFTDGLDEFGWLHRLYDAAVRQARQSGITMPDFSTFWQRGLIDLTGHDQPVSMLDAFRRDPDAHRLKTPSGRIEIFSERIAGFNLADCPGHAVWQTPFEWLGGPESERFPLHLLSDQPVRRLHSQLDHSPHSRDGKVAGREPVYLNPADAAARKIAAGDIVELFNDRGRCLAGAILSDDIMPGVARLATGAWFSPLHGLETHGNPNVLTLDRGASSLSQGCAAQTCLVQAKRFEGEIPAVLAYTLPELVQK